MTKKLTPFIVPDSGETIMISPVSLASITFQLRNEIPPPKPPLVEVVVFGKKQYERNLADPDYAEAVKSYNQELQIEATYRLLKRVGLKQKLTKEQKSDVAELREALEGERLPKSDKLLWFFEFAVGSDDDMAAITKAVSSLADPQEDRIREKVNGFQD